MNRFLALSLVFLLCLGCSHRWKDIGTSQSVSKAAPDLSAIQDRQNAEARAALARAQSALDAANARTAQADARMAEAEQRAQTLTAHEEAQAAQLRDAEMNASQAVAAAGSVARRPTHSRSSNESHPVAPALPVNVDPLANRVRDWFNQLSHGHIVYSVPTTLFWKEASTVSVVIQGPQSSDAPPLANATGSGTLKVSDRMKVVISSPDDPGEFSIEKEQGTEDIQFVPVNGSTTWNWSVTPKYTAKNQRIQISAWVLYSQNDDRIAEQLPVYSAVVEVHIPGFRRGLERIIEGDPDYWLKYGLPGGGGFIFCSAIFTWWLKRRTERLPERAAQV